MKSHSQYNYSKQNSINDKYHMLVQIEYRKEQKKCTPVFVDVVPGPFADKIEVIWPMNLMALAAICPL